MTSVGEYSAQQAGAPADRNGSGCYIDTWYIDTWLNRTGASYPGYFEAPEFIITALTVLPVALAAAP